MAGLILTALSLPLRSSAVGPYPKVHIDWASITATIKAEYPKLDVMSSSVYPQPALLDLLVPASPYAEVKYADGTAFPLLTNDHFDSTKSGTCYNLPSTHDNPIKDVKINREHDGRLAQYV